MRKPKWISTGLPERSNKRRAEKLLEELIRQHSEEQGREHPALFADYAAAWLESKRGSLEQSTWENYENVTRNHILPYFKKKKLALGEVKPVHIREYYAYKASHGRLDRKKGGLSHTTLQKHASVLRLIFEDALILEEIARNPALAVKLPRKVENDDSRYKDVVFLDAQEANRVIQAFEGELLQSLVFVTLYYGLRRSEVLGLKWDAIDFQENRLSIRHTVVKHNTIVCKDRTKSRRSRGSYPLLPEVREVLLQVREAQEQNRKLCGKQYKPSGYVFTWPDGSQIRPDYVTARFQKVLENKGFARMRFHDLRHSCASIHHEKGWQARDIQDWMRHADFETTMNIYTHISEQRSLILSKDLENTFQLGTPAAAPDDGVLETC